MNTLPNPPGDLATIPDGLQPFIHENTWISYSPGRINLIGEFTDYNNGFVLPAAIDKGVYFAITPRDDHRICLYSNDFREEYFTSTDHPERSIKSSWPNYILGVVNQFQQAGITLNGFDAAITGNMPIGSGLSSSAAVECSVALILNEISKSGFEKLQLVVMAQKAENDFVGVKCGIMDQFASMFGIPNQAIKIDCRSLEYEYLPLNMNGLRIVLLNSNVKHSHGTSEYNVRRQQCERGVAMIQQHEPAIESLRDATPAMLDKYILPHDSIIYKRCKFILGENERVLNAAENLKLGDVKAFGQKMFASHDGIKNLYEASCPEIDFLVEGVKENPSVLGARMMGGGFGGCSINLVKEEAVEDLFKQSTAAYRKSMNMELTAHVVSIEAGSTILKQPQARA